MRSLRRFIALVLLPSHLAACTSWQTHTAPIPQVLADRQPGEVRVYLADSTRVTLQAPLVENDSLVGYTPGATRAGAFAVPHRRAIALDSIARVEVKGHDATKTSVLVGSTVVLACVTAGAIVFFNKLEDSCWGGRCR